MKYARATEKGRVYVVENGVTRIVGTFGGSSKRRYCCNLCGEEVDTESAKYPQTAHSAAAVAAHLAEHGASKNRVIPATQKDHALWLKAARERVLSRARKLGASIALWSRLGMPSVSGRYWFGSQIGYLDGIGAFNAIEPATPGREPRPILSAEEIAHRRKVAEIKRTIRTPAIPFVAPANTEAKEFNTIGEAIEYLKARQFSELALDNATGHRDSAVVLFVTARDEVKGRAVNVGKMANGRIMVQPIAGKCWQQIEG